MVARPPLEVQKLISFNFIGNLATEPLVLASRLTRGTGGGPREGPSVARATRRTHTALAMLFTGGEGRRRARPVEGLSRSDLALSVAPASP